MQSDCFFLMPIPRKFNLVRRASLTMQARIFRRGGGGDGGEGGTFRHNRDKYIKFECRGLEW